MKMPKLLATCLAFILSATFAFPIAAHAYTSSCVSLIFGVGYAAHMRTKVEVDPPLYTDWSGSFAVGQTECQDISFLGEGIPFVAEVDAIAGNQKTCTPTITQSNGDGSAIWQASGTTLNVKCNMPSADSQVAQSAAIKIGVLSE